MNTLVLYVNHNSYTFELTEIFYGVKHSLMTTWKKIKDKVTFFVNCVGLDYVHYLYKMGTYITDPNAILGYANN
jgi:hypothetical protein